MSDIKQLTPLIMSGDEEEFATSLSTEQPLSPVGWLFHQSHLNCYILAIMGSGKRFDVDIIKAGLQATVVHHPRFSSLQVFEKKGRAGKGKWVKTIVDVENHVVVPDLSNLNPTNPDKFVEDYTSNLSTTTLDFSKPLWDLHLLNLKTSEAEAVAIFRCHHSLGDCTSLMSLLLACTRKSSDPGALPTIPNARVRVQKRKESHKGRRWWAGFGSLWNTGVCIAGYVATALWLKDTETPLKGRDGVEFNKKRFVHKTVSLEDVKTVKQAMGATVNDVMLGITSAGLTRYLKRKYNCTGYNGRELHENIRVRSTVLVNIRKSPGIHDLADMMKGEKALFGNRIGYMIFPFTIGECDDPLDYVHKAKVIADRKKASREASFIFWSSITAIKLFGIKTTSSISYKVASNTTLAFSNVVGPCEEVGFYSHPLVYLATSVYGHPHAITIHFESYVDKIRIALAVDETLISDPHQLCEDLIKSLDLMKIEVVKKASSTVNISKHSLML